MSYLRTACDGLQAITVTGDPLLIQSTRGRKGNFELLVPQGDTIVHYSRDNDTPPFSWRRVGELAYKARPGQLGPRPAGVAMIQSNFKADGVHGNCEAFVRVHAAIRQRTVFRSHLERGGKPVSGLEKVTVNIQNLVVDDAR